VKSIVETYHGSIWVQSEPGRGSTFRFTINGQYVVPPGGRAAAEFSGESSAARVAPEGDASFETGKAA